MTGEPIFLGPAPEAAQGAVILIHGRGSSGENISALAKAVPVKGVHWIAPTAPGNSWYPRRFLVPLNENEPHLSQALALIDGLVGKLKTAGLSVDQIGLAGFSQGACLVLEYAARNPQRYGFVAGLSGALIGPLDTKREKIDLKGTPVLLACADEDAHIPKAYVDHSENELVQANAVVTRLRFPGGAHTVFKEEVDWMTKALWQVVDKGRGPGEYK